MDLQSIERLTADQIMELLDAYGYAADVLIRIGEFWADGDPNPEPLYPDALLSWKDASHVAFEVSEASAQVRRVQRRVEERLRL